MLHEIEFDKDRTTVTIRASEQASVEGFEAYLKEVLGHPSWLPGMRALIDLRSLDASRLTKEQVRQISDLHVPYGERLGGGLCAIVVSDPLHFGLARMWEAYSDHRLFLRVRVFDSMDEAREWVNSGGGAHAAEEWVDLKSLEDLAAILAWTASTYCR
jgi:hypothetical protein